MGWPFNEATAVMLIVWTELLVVSPRCRRPLVRVGRAFVGVSRRAGIVAAVRPEPGGRPIEVIAHEARRLGHRYRLTRKGVSYAKSEAIRRAYDDVLAEGCDALGVAHLLGVLTPGDDLDTERARVERLLHIWGLSVDDAA